MESSLSGEGMGLEQSHFETGAIKLWWWSIALFSYWMELDTQVLHESMQPVALAPVR